MIGSWGERRRVLAAREAPSPPSEPCPKLTIRSHSEHNLFLRQEKRKQHVDKKKTENEKL